MKRIKATVEVEFEVEDDVVIDDLEMNTSDSCSSMGGSRFELWFGLKEDKGWSHWNNSNPITASCLKIEEGVKS